MSLATVTAVLDIIALHWRAAPDLEASIVGHNSSPLRAAPYLEASIALREMFLAPEMSETTVQAVLDLIAVATQT